MFSCAFSSQYFIVLCNVQIYSNLVLPITQKVCLKCVHSVIYYYGETPFYFYYGSIIYVSRDHQHLADWLLWPPVGSFVTVICRSRTILVVNICFVFTKFDKARSGKQFLATDVLVSILRVCINIINEIVQGKLLSVLGTTCSATCRLEQI